MNEPFNNTYELIEQYCLDLMDAKERHYFEMEMVKNPALKKAVDEHQLLARTFKHFEDSRFIHDSLDAIHKNSRSHTAVLTNYLKLHVIKYWKTASVAASVALLCSVSTFLVVRNLYTRDLTKGITQLNSKVDRITRVQNKTNKELNDVKNKVAVPQPEGESKSSGTAFALSQKGYLVTNYHVVDDYKNKKVFVFTSDAVAHPCEVVMADADNDLAILKISEEDFTFETKIPYSVQRANPAIAQRIYSLGYPKQDVVYNEGYISSITGFEGDSSRYQLELPAEPGASGAPIIDETGNVIGIVSGKQTQSEGITYAIKSKALLSLVKQLPDDFSSKELSTNHMRGLTRANQVKKIQPFVCVVKVYSE